MVAGVVRKAGRGALVGSVLALACSGDGALQTGGVGAVASLVITLSRDSLRPLEVAQAVAEGRDVAGRMVGVRNVRWSSGNEAVATVAPSGLISAVSAGEARISASAGSVSAETRVRVFNVPVNTVLVTPLRTVLVPGATTRLAALPVDAAGTPLPGRAITWFSSDTLRADVDSSGWVTARRPGVVSISALSEGVYASVDVRVSGPPGPVATVTPVPAAVGLAIGQSAPLQVLLEDVDGNEANGRPVTWASLAPTIATVTPQGVATGVARGSAQLRATSEGRSALVDVSVLDPADSIVVAFASPIRDDIVGDTLTIFASVDARHRIVRVHARLTSTERFERELDETPVGALGTRFAWTGTLDVSFLRYGPYEVVVTAWDELGNRSVASQPFKRGTREGKGGTTLPPRTK